MIKAKFVSICTDNDCKPYYPIVNCSELNGKIFDLERLDEIPEHDCSAPPIHYNCKCHLELVE